MGVKLPQSVYQRKSLDFATFFSRVHVLGNPTAFLHGLASILRNLTVHFVTLV